MEHRQLIWRAHRRGQAGRRIARDLKIDPSTVRYYLKLGPPPHDVKYDCLTLPTDTDGPLGAFRGIKVGRVGQPTSVSPPAATSGMEDKRGTSGGQTGRSSPGSPPSEAAEVGDYRGTNEGQTEATVSHAAPLPPGVARIGAARSRRLARGGRA
jgi:hypothetical protein